MNENEFLMILKRELVCNYFIKLQISLMRGISFESKSAENFANNEGISPN